MWYHGSHHQLPTYPSDRINCCRCVVATAHLVASSRHRFISVFRPRTCARDPNSLFPCRFLGAFDPRCSRLHRLLPRNPRFPAAATRISRGTRGGHDCDDNDKPRQALQNRQQKASGGPFAIPTAVAAFSQPLSCAHAIVSAGACRYPRCG